jgi:lambda repressor-like predicted transcriptional regulator
MNTMTEKSTLPELSDATVAQLKRLRDTDRPAFYEYVASLRKNKWPLRAISQPLGVSRSIVQIWENKVAENTPLPVTEQLPKAIDDQVKPIYLRYELSDEESTRMYVLAREASKVRRFTDSDSPAREAALELEELLHYHKERGASLNTLKVACGVSRRAIAQRLEKRDKAS